MIYERTVGKLLTILLMNVGISLGLLNISDRPDHQVYREFLSLGELAEPLGFDSVWTVEHHFTGHSPVPNALQFLSYLAGRTRNIFLGTAVLVLPWHHPIRVAEEISMLDILSGGRLITGLGRGVSAVEYAGFGIAMEESRERFNEALAIVISGITQESFSFTGRYYQIPELSIRPRPISNLRERFYGAAESPESSAIMGRLGVGLFISPRTDLSFHTAQISHYRQAAIQAGYPVRRPICKMYVSVGESAEESRDIMQKYCLPMFEQLDRHYNFSSGKLQGIKSYEYFAGSIKPYAKETDSLAKSEAIEKFIEKNISGTPKQCLERIEQVYKATGIGHFVGEFSFGGMPNEACIRAMQLFSSKVMPVLQDPKSFPIAL